MIIWIIKIICLFKSQMNYAGYITEGFFLYGMWSNVTIIFRYAWQSADKIWQDNKT